MNILEWIDFGKVSAERDDLLSQYFYDNQVLSSVISSPSSFLILGRKGAGKTAVFQFLRDNRGTILTNGEILIPLSFEDYNWSIHAILTNEAKAESLLYKQSWRFVILVECVKAYSEWFKGKGRAVPKKIEAAERLLEKLFDSPIPSIYQIVGRKLLSLSRIKLPGGGVDLEGGELDSINVESGEISFEQVRQDAGLKGALSENIENLISILERALSEADEKWPTVFVCFDRVDEAWDSVSYETSKRVIAGLVSAADSINASYKGKIRPLVFLREDIFDVLSINDANKLREDCGALLHWNKPSLINMLLRRVNYFAKQKGAPVMVEIDNLFDKSEMRQRAKPINYLIRRTMMRPRDIISLLSRTVSSMREKSEDPFADGVQEFQHIECESIYAAEPGYSEWLKQEIIDEWGVQRPEIRALLDALQNNGSTSITQDALTRELIKIDSRYSVSDTNRHLRFLFDNSVIGIKIGASTEWKYKCFYPSQGFVESDEYRVHDGLVRVLNLTEPRERDGG
ncbi:hypothetical protein V4F39_23865 [Aquincola sp. MAHUQ-54]|uniref:ATPase n=1 Tax=Aquincola agrisoli TaxID=3119538 RepID=A0AAW9QI74_9BURK